MDSNHMNDSFIFVFSSLVFLHGTQLWVEGLGMACSALNHGCGTTLNGE